MMEKQNRKVLAIGLDAAETSLILKWCDSGDLPNLAKLRANGLSGAMQTFPGLADDAIWASFSTGDHPGRHGRFHNVQIHPDSRHKIYIKDDFLKSDPFWKKISESGKRVVVVDVPKTPLVEKINGIQVCDWRTHGRDGETRSHPPELAGALLEEYGADENDNFSTGKALCKMTAITEEERERLFAILKHSIEQKTKYLEKLIRTESWDLFLSVFKESHCAGHQFWNPNKTVSLEDGSEKHSRYLKQIYQQLDAALGRLLGAIDEQTEVIVFTNLGMAANHPGEHLLDKILLHLDTNSLQHFWRKVGHSSLWPKRFSNRVDRRLLHDRQAIQVPHNEISGAVLINRCYSRSDESYRKLVSLLKRELAALVDPITAEPLVLDVVETPSLYHGKAAPYLPDLLIVWNRKVKITDARLSSGKIVRCVIPNYRPGNHVPGGYIFARSCSPANGEIQNTPSITDLAPTIANLLEIDTNCFDGSPISEFVSSETL